MKKGFVWQSRLSRRSANDCSETNYFPNTLFASRQPVVSGELLSGSCLTHRWTSLQPGAFTDDLWSPTLFEPQLDFCPDLIREPTRPRPQSPPLRLLVRLLWTVTPAACVAGKLPADAARRSPQSPSNLSQSISFLTPTVDVSAVCLCHTLVSHIVLQVFDHTKNITYRGAFSYNRCCNSRWNAGGYLPPCCYSCEACPW